MKNILCANSYGMRLIMYKSDFELLLRELINYFGVKSKYDEVKVEQVGEWAEQVKHIPLEAVNYIKQKFKDDYDRLPGNIPKAIKRYYYEWKNANGEKLIQYPKTDCKECGGSGFIFCKRYNEQAITKTETTVYRCRYCKNWQEFCHQDAVPEASKAELTGKGYQLI